MSADLQDRTAQRFQGLRDYIAGENKRVLGSEPDTAPAAQRLDEMTVTEAALVVTLLTFYEFACGIRHENVIAYAKGRLSSLTLVPLVEDVRGRTVATV